jgi:uncharacterized membrane protein YhhN
VDGGDRPVTEWGLTAVTAASVALLVWSIRNHSPLHRPSKMVASTGFLAVAVAVGAAETGFGRLVIAALTLSWLGDLFLSYTGRAPFLAGLGAFLLAHVAYVVAFVERGVSEPHPLEPAAIGILAVLVGRWLLPFVAAPMRGPVIAYIVAISAMVIFAGATAQFDADSRLRLGAVAFFVSDLTVARDRFVAPGFANRAVGLPLYYAGQLLLAWSAGG